MLTTEVKTHVIVSFDGSHKHITKKQYEKVMKCQEHGLIGLEIDGGFYKLSDMKKIPTVDEFHDQYPDKRPNTTPDTYRANYSSTPKRKKPIKDVANRIKKGYIAGMVEKGMSKKEAEKLFSSVFPKVKTV